MDVRFTHVLATTNPARSRLHLGVDEPGPSEFALLDLDLAFALVTAVLLPTALA